MLRVYNSICLQMIIVLRLFGLRNSTNRLKVFYYENVGKDRYLNVQNSLLHYQ
jgi:hypothetical protein